MTRSTPFRFSPFRDLRTIISRSAALRFSPFEVSFAILAALALALSPQAALAQHSGGGGGGHAGGGGHFGSGGGHASAGFGTGGHSSAGAGSHVSSPIHVYSGPRSAPLASAPAPATLPRSSHVFVPPSGTPRGLGMFAEPSGSGDVAAATRTNRDPRVAAPPMHTTIGFPPSTDPRFASVSSAHRGAPLTITGQGAQMWQSSRGAVANRNMPPIMESRVPLRTSPNPPHIFRRPPLSGAPFFSSPGFIFFSPGFGFFGNGFGCDPFFISSFGCGGFFPCGFGCGSFGFLGFDGGFGDFGNAGFGYGYGGYYPPPNYNVTAPSGDEGASEEPAPSEYQNPPAENSGAESPIPVPDTVIYLKDGTTFAVRDYWVADGKLHYVTSYGGQNAVDLSELDLQRTTDENAAHGISITLRPAPDAQTPDSQPQQPQPPAANPAPEGTPR